MAFSQHRHGNALLRERVLLRPDGDSNRLGSCCQAAQRGVMPRPALSKARLASAHERLITKTGLQFAVPQHGHDYVRTMGGQKGPVRSLQTPPETVAAIAPRPHPHKAAVYLVRRCRPGRALAERTNRLCALDTPSGHATQAPRSPASPGGGRRGPHGACAAASPTNANEYRLAQQPRFHCTFPPERPLLSTF